MASLLLLSQPQVADQAEPADSGRDGATRFRRRGSDCGGCSARLATQIGQDETSTSRPRPPWLLLAAMLVSAGCEAAAAPGRVAARRRMPHGFPRDRPATAAESASRERSTTARSGRRRWRSVPNGGRRICRTFTERATVRSIGPEHGPRRAAGGRRSPYWTP